MHQFISVLSLSSRLIHLTNTKSHNRQVIFEGDLHTYIYAISFIYFTIIRDTALIYTSCFPAIMMSACVKWAKEHVDEFNVMLERQLSSVSRDSETWERCMKQAREHAGLLAEAGLDFRGLIGGPTKEK
jgi:hypothetical protein